MAERPAIGRVQVRWLLLESQFVRINRGHHGFLSLKKRGLRDARSPYWRITVTEMSSPLHSDTPLVCLYVISAYSDTIGN